MLARGLIETIAKIIPHNMGGSDSSWTVFALVLPGQLAVEARVLEWPCERTNKMHI